MKKKSRGSKSIPALDPSTFQSIQFRTAAHKDSWTPVCCRSFVAERAIHLGQFEKTGLIEFFEKDKLLISVTKILPFVKQVVLEFYANLSTGMFDPSFEEYGKAVVRGVTSSLL